MLPAQKSRVLKSKHEITNSIFFKCRLLRFTCIHQNFYRPILFQIVQINFIIKLVFFYNWKQQFKLQQKAQIKTFFFFLSYIYEKYSFWICFFLETYLPIHTKKLNFFLFEYINYNIYVQKLYFFKYKAYLP